MAKVKLTIKGKDAGASKAVNNVASSMLKAQVAFAALTAGFKKLVEMGKKSIEFLEVQGEAETKLRAATETNIDAFKEYATSIQEVTTVGDEAILTIQTMMSAMGVANDGLNEAAKGAVGLSKSLGIGLSSAARLSANAMTGNFSALTRYIPALKSATTDAEKMAIVQDAMAKGFRVAEAEAATFTGQLRQLSNLQGDNYEAFGRIVSVVGKDYVEVMKNGAQALNDFLTNTDMIADIAGAFEVLKTIFIELGTEVFSVVKDEFNEIKGSIEKLLPKVEDGVSKFDFLAATVKLISLGLTVAIKIIGGTIQRFVDMVRIVKAATKAYILFNQNMFQPKKWKETGEALGQLKDVFIDTAKNGIGSTMDIIDTVVNGFKSLPNEIEQSTIKYRDTFLQKSKEIREEFEKDGDENVKNNKDSADQMADDVAGAGDQIIKTWGMIAAESHIDWKKEHPFQGLIVEAKEAFEQLSIPEKFEAITKSVQAWGSKAIELTREVMGGIQDVINASNAENIANQEQWIDDSLSNVDSWINEQLAMHGVQAQTRTQAIDAELRELDKKLSFAQTAEEQAAAEGLVNKKKKELEEAKILDAGERKKEAIRQKGAAKITEEKRKQFMQDKAFSIANIWLNAAAATMGWWASLAPLGMPGIILAAVMSAATMTMAGVQTGLVASQTFHGEQGGIVPAGGTSGDNTQIFANKGEALLRNDDFNALVSQARGDSPGGRPIIIENMTVVADDPESFRRQTVELALFEGNM